MFSQKYRAEFVGNEFLRGWNIYSHIAWMLQRWRGNTNMHLKNTQTSLISDEMRCSLLTV
jgi:hypothetical protein